MVVTAYSIYLTFEAAAFRTLGETTERMGIRFVLQPVEKILFPLSTESLVLNAIYRQHFN